MHFGLDIRETGRELDKTTHGNISTNPVFDELDPTVRMRVGAKVAMFDANIWYRHSILRPKSMLITNLDFTVWRTFPEVTKLRFK